MNILITVVLAFALARFSLAQSSEPVPEPTATPSSEPVPEPTATPSPSEPVEIQTFYLTEVIDKNKTVVCLHMEAAIVVSITYLNGTNKKNATATTVVALTNRSSIVYDRSSCNSTTRKATLYLIPDEDDLMLEDSFAVVFTFTGAGDSKWTMGNTSISVNASYLDDYTATTGVVNITTKKKLLTNPNDKIEDARSYACKSDTNLTFNRVSEIQPLLMVSKLRVQAFRFENNTSGAFDNPRTCLADSAGKANKIVPIAVGAALAGLVVVVLVAYLIGRLRSRRQSSYEALS